MRFQEKPGIGNLTMFDVITLLIYQRRTSGAKQNGNRKICGLWPNKYTNLESCVKVNFFFRDVVFNESIMKIQIKKIRTDWLNQET